MTMTTMERGQLKGQARSVWNIESQISYRLWIVTF